MDAVDQDRLDGAADRAEDAADLAAQEDEGDDSDDGDEGQDQCVLGQTLTFGSVGPPEGGQSLDTNAHSAAPSTFTRGIQRMDP